MQSTTATATATATTSEYVHNTKRNNVNIWNIRSSTGSAAVADYYLREEMTLAPLNEPINKALLRDHALVSGAFTSSHTLIQREFPKYVALSYAKAMATTAQWCAPHPRVNATRRLSSVYQKHHLVTISGLCGLLTARLFNTGHTKRSMTSRHVVGGVSVSNYDAPEHLALVLNRWAHFTSRYIHSALTSELLIGNRYYRNIAQHSSLNTPIGNISKKYTLLSEPSPSDMAVAKQELCQVYNSTIERLTHTVKQYKRGFMNLATIHSDPQFERLLTLFWDYANKVMKCQNEFEKCVFPGIYENKQYADDVDEAYENMYLVASRRFFEQKNAKRFLVVSDVSELCALVPRLYDYDVVHLFDSVKQTYARFVGVVKETLVRLANDGLTSAFLSFAAIQPDMVTSDFAPKHATKYQHLCLKSCANHIPSSHPVYGALRVQYREHIPRTADVVENISRDEACPVVSRKSSEGHEEGEVVMTINDEIQEIRKPIRKLLAIQKNRLLELE